ncbi:hypothetical protein, partial [Dubosiella newyorkensis]
RKSMLKAIFDEQIQYTRISMNKWGSWELFIISIGLLFIVSSPMYDKPIIIVIEGLCIILIGIILFRNKNSKKKNQNTTKTRRNKK